VKRVFVAVTIVVSLLAASFAFASKTGFSGTIDPGGTLTFKLVKKNGKEKILDLNFLGLPVQCQTDGPQTTSGNVPPPSQDGVAIPVKADGSFTTTLIAGNTSNPDAYLKFAGQLKHHDKKAVGTINVHGTQVTESGPTSPDNCTSGTQNWSAQAN
jgi:hypothetical protein